MTAADGDARRRSRAQLEAGNFGEALREAREGLSAQPDDVELLVLAGQAAVELDDDEAVELLTRATELAPGDPGAWHHLGEALAAEGHTARADSAFRRAVALDPEDQVALTHLGHTSLATGHGDEAVEILSRAAERIQGASTAAISLVDMYRSMGRFEEAALHAKRLAEVVPDDPLAWLDLAELSLETGQHEQAASAFERLREIDDVPGHELYPLHGLLRVALRDGQAEQIRSLAEQVVAIDPHGAGAGAAALLEDSGEGLGLAAGREDLDAALGASLAGYRRSLAEERRLGPEDADG